MALCYGRTYRSAQISAVISLISLLLIVAAFTPAAVRASVISNLFSALTKVSPPGPLPSSDNVQTMAVLMPATNIDPTPAQGGGDVTIVDDSAVVPAEGPSGTIADIEKPKNGTISMYVVRDGDTIESVAKLFNVKPSTILWANDIKQGTGLSVGQQLVILPITGVRYTTKPGDTLQSIAQKFDGDAAEIASYNGLDTGALAANVSILIPNGEIAASAAPQQPTPPTPPNAPKLPRQPKQPKIFEPAHDVGPVGTVAEVDYYIAPLAHYIETQGIHGYNAVDLAAPIGTPIMASAAGEVIVAKAGGWNGGYGSYVVIQHNNGSQTLYGHMSKVAAYDGEEVAQGELIGYVGVTGKSTGPHVHFEIRDGIRNPF